MWNAFNAARVGKFYCSARCKQFGYNHKEKNTQSRNISDWGINAKSQTFYIEDFQFYDERMKMLKKYKELKRKEINFEKYNSIKLTENDEFELYELEMEIEEELQSLSLKGLSIEQWSFIKIVVSYT